MNDFCADPEALLEKQRQAFARVMQSGWYILGPEVKHFEREWAAACRIEHAIGVANGLDAIEIGLRISGVGPGDEVITTPMTAFATVLAVIRAGATPVLADIDPETGLLDPESVARCLSPQTKGVLLVHLYGQVRNMDRWVQFCQQHRIALFEDCAQSHLSSWQGQVAGSFGAWGAYSFYPTKNLGALGDAGALVTRDPKLDAQARQLRNYGQSERYYHPQLGMNSRLDELQAGLLRARLEWLAGFTRRRQEIAQAYFEGLHQPALQLLARPVAIDNHCYHLFVVSSPRRTALIEHLKSRGVESLIHYPVPVHHQEPTRSLRRDPNGLSQAEAHATRCLSLPCHPNMSDAQVHAVIEAVNAFK